MTKAKTHHQKAIEKILMLAVGAQRGALQCIVVSGPNPGFVVGLRTPTTFIPLARIMGTSEIENTVVSHFDHPLAFNQDRMQSTIDDLAEIPDLDAVVSFLNALDARLDVDDAVDFEALLHGGA